MKNFLAVFIIIITCQVALSQRGVSETGLWSQYFYTVPLSERFKVAGDFQFRTYEVTNDFQQFIARTAIAYTPKAGTLELHAGYGYFYSEPFGSGDAGTSEHRLHQDVWMDTDAGKTFGIRHRFRFEERFIEDQDFRSRARYTLFVNVNFYNSEEELSDFYLPFWNEIFINGETQLRNSTVERFDRNWSFGGVGYRLNSDLRIQAGYMREITSNSSKGQVVLAVFQTF
ncbi:Protein of unknown function [Nonlabens sp. Hel1_33_55]|uniref:DUF2490 domain-containing protein n=1 Tax=Nonlabens sp. Hel1_33_55 TaxID=1336802 RepID=UPI000875AFE7|nr:DUF2490 domain-containing protein [Nonlabens sp. Hel1_33_55]SCX97462.1 Protein of unknown function [Nonlabens sp. Hel1_33_55]